MAFYASLCLYESTDILSEEMKKFLKQNHLKKPTKVNKEKAKKFGMLKENGDPISYHLKKFNNKEYVCFYSDFDGKKYSLIHKWVFDRGWTWLFDEEENRRESKDGLFIWYEIDIEKARENLEKNKEFFLNKEDCNKAEVEEIYKEIKEWLDQFLTDCYLVMNEPS